MIKEVSRILEQFRPCFSRNAAFDWFVVSIFGFMIRLDQYGVSSFIRWLGFGPHLYTSLLWFFRSSSWELKNIMQRWWSIVLARCPLIEVDGRLLLAGDGIKISKEAEKMPGVKRLHQESDNSGKAPYIYGHHHGVIGILAGWVKKLFCIPLCAEPHEGVDELRKLQGKAEPEVKGQRKVSVTTLMAAMAAEIVSVIGRRAIIVLDAYFSVGPVFSVLEAVVDTQGRRLIHIVTRAKRNVVAYGDPPPKTGKPGRPPTYGTKVHLMDWFESMAEKFEKTTIFLYGLRKQVSFLCLDLILAANWQESPLCFGS